MLTVIRLAASEGRITKWRELYDDLTPRDLTILEAFTAIEPWGERRADLREAWMACLIAASFSGAKLDPNKIADYLADPLEKSAKESVVSPEQAAARFRQMYRTG